MLLNGQLHFLPVPFSIGQRHAPRAHGGEKGVFPDFHPPAGAVRQVQVKPVELEEGHGVNHALDLRHGEEVAGYVQHDAPPFKTGDVPDGEDGHGEAVLRPVGIQYLHHALPRVEEACGRPRFQMQHAPPFPASFQTRLISFPGSRGVSFHRTNHVRRVPVTGHGEAGQDALGVKHIQDGFHCGSILFRSIDRQPQRKMRHGGPVGRACGRSGEQHILRREHFRHAGVQEPGQSQPRRHPVKTPLIHHSGSTGSSIPFFQ